MTILNVKLRSNAWVSPSRTETTRVPANASSRWNGAEWQWMIDGLQASSQHHLQPQPLASWLAGSYRYAWRCSEGRLAAKPVVWGELKQTMFVSCETLVQ